MSLSCTTWSESPTTTEPQAYMHAKSLQSCPTLCNPMDSSPPDSSVHRILQARILEWVSISFSRVFVYPKQTWLNALCSNSAASDAVFSIICLNVSFLCWSASFLKAGSKYILLVFEYLKPCLKILMMTAYTYKAHILFNITLSVCASMMQMCCEVRAKSLQSCPALCDLMGCSLPCSSVRGILRARILEWVAMPSFWESSRPRDQACISYISCFGMQAIYQ